MAIVTKPGQVVWTFRLDRTHEPQLVNVPVGARMVHLAWFKGRPTMWWLFERTRQSSTTTRSFQLAGTGQDMPPDNRAAYRGSVIEGGTHIWHLYELLG